MKYVITNSAERDLELIKAYLRPISLDASRTVRDELTKAFRFLASHPRAGIERPDLTSRAFRFWTVYSYLIVYDPRPKPIRIIRVVHGARDLPTVLVPLEDSGGRRSG